MTHEPLTLNQVLAYEIYSRHWFGFIGWDWLQTIAARYVARLTARKYMRYKAFLSDGHLNGTPPRVQHIVYRNHRGECATRVVKVIGLRYGVAKPWYTEPQYLLEVYDLVKRANRTFAISNIIQWSQE